MSFKFSLVFVQLFCLLVVTKCMENWQFDISDVISEASPLYATRDLPADQLKNKATAQQPTSAPKEIYTLATVFSNGLRAVMYKITQTLVKIGQKEEGYKTMLHLYQQLYDISSNEISRYTLTYFMDKMVEVWQDETAVKNIEEIFQTIQDLMQRDLRNWHFVLPFLNDMTNNPNLFKIIEAGLAELKFIMDDETRTNTVKALFVMIENGFEDVEPVPLDGTKGAAVVKVEVANSAASKGSPASVSSVGKDGVVPTGSSASVSNVPAVAGPAPDAVSATTGSITSVPKASGTGTAASASKDVAATNSSTVTSGPAPSATQGSAATLTTSAASVPKDAEGPVSPSATEAVDSSLAAPDSQNLGVGARVMKRIRDIIPRGQSE